MNRIARDAPSRPRGVIAATATPVDADFRPDVDRLVRHCRVLLDGGCDAINLLGTTGEATAFGVEQRIRVMRAIAEDGLPLGRFMVGTGVPALDETVRLTRAACELGFAGALVLPPYYYPDVSDDGLVAYVDALVARVDHPALAIYLYHIPQNTKVPWPLEVVVRLRERHGATLVGLKDSAGDLAYARAVAARAAGFRRLPELGRRARPGDGGRLRRLHLGDREHDGARSAGGLVGAGHGGGRRRRPQGRRAARDRRLATRSSSAVKTCWRRAMATPTGRASARRSCPSPPTGRGR